MQAGVPRRAPMLRRVLPALLLMLWYGLPAVAAPRQVVPVGSMPVGSMPVRLIDHQALYRLTLRNGRGQVIGAAGTMGYEVEDSCHDWIVHQRLALNVSSVGGQTSRMITDYVTTEAKDGLRLRFRMTQTTDGAITSRTKGVAWLDRPGGPGVAEYTQPAKKRVDLPAGTLFPMADTAALLRAAESGRRFFTVPVFDGTDAHGAELSSVVVLHRTPAAPDRWPALAALPSVVVQIAFFGPDPAHMLPDYQVGMRYWTNGVAGRLRMDFGDFVVAGRLIGFRPLPPHC